ncbi:MULTISPECIES: PilZ domain-containing protein [Oceanimonas]|uniref:PilZ domain-containing protein n=1 Tax=Oceanimonas TaxID=129577 RepID=UPI00035D2EDF|nr:MULTISPECIES: PilZ domain-containing protein [Oceanimonas]MDV2859032.1 PilZ domain-containing protein [Oceanimonas sp. CAM02]
MSERRAFSRIEFNASALLIDADGHPFTAQVKDISLHGALLTLNTPWQINDGGELILQLMLDDGSQITMHGYQRHHENHLLGLECKQLDLDSATRLRRLVELNLGNEQLLHRQFEQLLAEDQ